MLEISYLYTRKEHETAAAAAWAARTGRFFMWLLPICGLVVIAGVLFDFLFVSRERMLLYLVSVGVGLILFQPVTRHAQVRKSFSAHPWADKPVTLSFTVQSMTIRAADGVSHLNWPDVTKAYKTKSGFALFIAGNRFHWVPLHAPTPSQVADLEHLLDTTVRGGVTSA